MRPNITFSAAAAVGLAGTMLLLQGCPKKGADGAAEGPNIHVAEEGQMGDFCDFKGGPDQAPVRVVAYYPGRHEDTLAAVKKLLTTYPEDVSVEIVDWRRPEGIKRRNEAGLVCAGVTINDKNAFELEADGKTSKVLFVRGIDGEWTEEDLNAAVKQVIAEAGE